MTPKGGDVLLECANCGHPNVLGVGSSGDPSRSSEADASELAGPGVAGPGVGDESFDRERARALLNPKKPTPEEELDRFQEEAMARLVPQPGPGPRCPKCVHLVEPSAKYCSRCGLNVVAARAHLAGDAPWEKAPAGKEDAWEQGQLLWASLEEDWTREKFENFANFVREEGLLEMATRKIKWRLVEEPEDEAARELLAEIASELQSRIIVARARARANVEQFSDVTQRAKTAILWTTLVLWLLILLILVVAYAC